MKTITLEVPVGSIVIPPEKFDTEFIDWVIRNMPNTIINVPVKEVPPCSTCKHLSDDMGICNHPLGVGKCKIGINNLHELKQ